MLPGAFAVLLHLAGCAASCGSDEHLAELTSFSGQRVERDSARSLGSWHRALANDRFHMGDGLRTGPDSVAELALSPSGLAHVEPRTLLRFLASAPSQQGVALESGAVEILAEQMDIEIHTPRAVAKLMRGSTVKLTASEGRERFDLIVGRVFVSHDQRQDTLELSKPLELGRAPAASDAASSASAEPDAASDAGPVETGALEPADAAPPTVGVSAVAAMALDSARGEPRASHPELRLLLGEQATIHGLQLPVDVRLTLPPCERGAKLQLGKDGEVLSEREGLVRLPAGRHRIRILCAGEPARQTLLVVKHDAAMLELPQRAQNARVEADGRRYTVLYQNLLPTITFVWPGSHEGDKFTLLLRRGKRDQPFELSRPEHVLSGSTLGEGEHTFWFRDQAGRSSKPGSVRLSFDNAARSAYLSSPAEGSPVGDGKVLVEGAALQRSEVRVNGSPVVLDDKGRFRSEVVLGPAQRSISVRVQHPESGVHYYLRHLR